MSQFVTFAYSNYRSEIGTGFKVNSELVSLRSSNSMEQSPI
jgi:hypothetical protein